MTIYFLSPAAPCTINKSKKMHLAILIPMFCSCIITLSVGNNECSESLVFSLQCVSKLTANCL